MQTQTSPRAASAAAAPLPLVGPVSAYAAPLAEPRPKAADLPTVVQQVVESFEEFKKKHSAMLEGKADATEVQGVNDNVTRLSERIDDLNRSVGRLTVGGAVGGTEGSATRASARRFFQAMTGRRLRRGEQPDMEAYNAYYDAFLDLLYANGQINDLAPEVRASLSVGSDRSGGYFVPPEMSMDIERRIFETSPMRQVARVVSIGSDAWEGLYKSSRGASGGWVGERQPRPSTDTGKVGMQRIEVHEQYALPELTQNMLDDAVIDAETFLLEDTQEEMVLTENQAFVLGDGVMKPRGFLSYAPDASTAADKSRDWGKLQYVPSGSAGGFPKISGSSADDAGSLIDLMAALNPAYRAGSSWAMNRQTEAAVRKLRDADGRYLVGFGDLGDGVFGFTLHGYPIANMEDMPDIGADSFSIGYGNWRRGYWVVDRFGFRVLVDPYTNKPYVGFYITKRTGGDVRNFDAIKLMKFATT